MIDLNKIHNMKCPEGLKMLPDGCVNTCVTSPPYWQLRDYNVAGQIGLEETPEEYVQKLVEVFSEVKRMLRDDGTCWINLGDSYASGSKNRTPEQANANSTLSGSLTTQEQSLKQNSKIVSGLKPKDLVGIPWMVAFALRADGWYLRQDIIWHKPNPMPESVSDRCTKSHEYIFLLSKSSSYYYDADAIAEPAIYAGITGMDSTGFKDPKNFNGKHSDKQRCRGRRHAGFNERWDNMTTQQQCSGMRNKRSVWTVSTKPLPESHFATFPPDLISPCILAGCPENGVVLDPFMGAGTTALVAKKLNRQFIGFELNPDYIKIAENRLRKELGMFHPSNLNT